MAALGSLVVSLEANIARFSQDMARASQQTQQAMTQMSAASQQTRRAMDAVSAATEQARTVIIGLGAAVSAQKLMAYADSWASVESKIRLTTSSAAELARAEGQLFNIAIKNHSAIEPVVALYSRLNTASANLGASQKDIIKFTEGVSAALRLSGASSGEAHSAMLQLSQSMSNVTVQGQEFNAIQDAAPGLLITAAEHISGLGGSVSKLRNLMLDGKLESKLFFNAILSGADATIARAGTMQLTIGQAWTDLNTELTRFVGEASKSSGAGVTLASAIQALAGHLNIAADVLSGLLVYKLAEWALLGAAGLKAKAVAAGEAVIADRAQVAAAVAAAESAALERTAQIAAAEADVAATGAAVTLTNARVAELRAAVLAASGHVQLALVTNGLIPAQTRAAAAAEAHTLALTSLARAEALLTAETPLLTGALAMVGGPVGLITLALGAGVSAWMLWKDSAKSAAADAAQAVYVSTEEIIKNLDRQNQKRQEAIDLARKPLTGPSVVLGTRESEGESRRRELQAQIKSLQDNTGYARTMSLNERTRRVMEAKESLGKIDAGIALGKEKDAELARVEGQKKLNDWLGQNGTKAQRLAAELAKVKTELGAAFTPEVEALLRKKYEEKPDRSAASAAKAAVREEDRSVKNKAAGEVKAVEDQLARSQSAWQFNNQYVAELRRQDLINETQYNDFRKLALETNLGNIRQAYAEQIRIEEAWRATLKKGSEKEAAQTRIDALREKARLAGQEAQQQSAMLNLTIQGEAKDSLSKLKFKAVDKEDPASVAAKKTREADKDYQANIRIIEAQRKDSVTSLNEYHALVEKNEADHEERLRLIHQETAELKAKNDLEEVRRAGAVADQLYNLLKQAGMENSALGKAAFLFNKAMAVQEIILNTEVAASKAGAQLGIFGIPMAQVIRVTGYASAGMVAGMAIAEVSAEGGYDIPAGKNPLVQAHETEMILPRAEANVIRGLSRENRGALGALTIINQTTGRIDSVQEFKLSSGERALLIKEAVMASAAEMRNPNSESHRSVKSAFDIATARN